MSESMWVGLTEIVEEIATTEFIRIPSENLTDALSWTVERAGLSHSSLTESWSPHGAQWSWFQGHMSDCYIFAFRDMKNLAMLFKLTFA